MVTERDILMYTTYHGCTLHSAVERGGGEGERGGREGGRGIIIVFLPCMCSVVPTM